MLLAAKALRVAKLTDNFIKGLPDTLYNLLVLSHALELNDLISKAFNHLDYIQECTAVVTFKLGENVNIAPGPSTDGSGARKLLSEEREMGLVHQIEEFKITSKKLES